MRIPKHNRQQRRGMDVNAILRYNAARRFNTWADNDLRDIERELDRMISRVRTLKHDEGKKAKNAPSQAAVIAEAAMLNAWSEGIEESRKDYLIPRRALTVKLHLALVRPLIETQDRTWKQLTPECLRRLRLIHANVMREHPDHRAALAARLAADFVPEWTVGSDAFQTWRSDSTLLDSHRLIGGTVKVTRQTANTRTFERDGEREPLPTWTDENGNIVDPNTPTDTFEDL